MLDLERLDDLAEIGRVAAEVDRVADLERPAVEADGRDADPGVVVRDDPDLLFRRHEGLGARARYFSAPAVSPDT
ncbi:MAG: hypothetical protein A2W08_11000 [Candidatus Rokubacteria bacterium RBG_16_73_20]|nr:MAG: hypothetical protein A2W08_11000 [Candidatus Rokubacteria bacterium RBG_16_73_20]